MKEEEKNIPEFFSCSIMQNVEIPVPIKIYICIPNLNALQPFHKSWCLKVYVLKNVYIQYL